MASDTVDTVAPSVPTSATKPPRKSPGRPFTKENAKQMQLSAAKAKRMRKEARAKMLQAMCTKLDLGEQLVDAINKNDLTKMNIVEKALIIVGLTHNQSSEAVAQKLNVEAKTDSKVTGFGNLNITFTDPKPKETT